jgi:hypothetical protein
MDKAEDFGRRLGSVLQRRQQMDESYDKYFGDDYIKSLQIPCFINNYNQYIGGVDLANQYRRGEKGIYR